MRLVRSVPHSPWFDPRICWDSNICGTFFSFYIESLIDRHFNKKNNGDNIFKLNGNKRFNSEKSIQLGNTDNIIESLIDRHFNI